MRSLGLALAGSLVLGTLIITDPSAAAPKEAIKLPTRSLSFEQQQVASAWYRLLGKYKRQGLDAAQRGDWHAVNSAIQRVAIVITDAKNGEGALGKLPIVIRKQIAKEGRRVVKTLSARSGNAAGGKRGSHTAKGTKDKDGKVFYAITNFFEKIGTTQPSSSKSRSGSSKSSNARNRDARQPATNASRRAALFNRKWKSDQASQASAGSGRRSLGVIGGKPVFQRDHSLPLQREGEDSLLAGD